jgi:uncharacterized protein YutE (UPF0331/DUF86 family)
MESEKRAQILNHAKKRFERFGFSKTTVDEIAKDAVCRALTETLEIALTAGNMIIAQNDFRKPEKNDDIFDILAEEKVYPRSLANKLWGAGGFRNILVHDYVDLDLNLVYDYLEKGIPSFKEYARYIAKFLK